MDDRPSLPRYHNWLLAFLLATTNVVKAYQDCVQSQEMDTSSLAVTPFMYCPKQDAPWVQHKFSFRGNLCSKMETWSRVKLQDVLAFPEGGSGLTPKPDECGQINKIRYKTQLNCSEESTLVRPFLEEFSFKRPSLDEVKELSLPHFDGIVAYVFECIPDSGTIDMCHHNTSIFESSTKLKFEFIPTTLGPASNCYCYVTSSEPGAEVKVRAMDVRLGQGNRLLFDSHALDKPYYWWRDGVLRSGFSQIQLLNLDQHRLPERVWMEVSGVNLSVSCDVKPLDVPGNKDRSGSGSSASPVLSISYIIGIVVGILVLLILMLIMMRCLKQRRKDREDVEMEGYDMAGQMSESSEKIPEEEILLSTQEGDVEYSKPRKVRKDNSVKPIEVYEKPRDYKELPNESNDGAWSYDSRDSDNAESPGHFSQDGASRNNTNPGAIYSHLGDKPDIVPSSSNIYDSTGKDDYSLLDRNPKPVTTDSLYDVA